MSGNFFLDATRAVDVAVVSHAHSDHACSSIGEIICTAETAGILSLRFDRRRLPKFRILEYGAVINLGGVEVSLHPAGHMLGSAQVLMKYKGKSYLYTGDFKVQPDATCHPFEYLSTDVLITESTFGDPAYRHPNPEEEILKLQKFNNVQVVIGTYSVGKAQRITKLLTASSHQFDVHVHADIIPYHRQYEKLGVDLGKWKPFNERDFMTSNNNVLVVSPQVYRKVKTSAGQIKLFATGWNNMFHRPGNVLRVSDHADWHDLLDVIERSGAQQVYTVHGDGRHLRKHFAGTRTRVEDLV